MQNSKTKKLVEMSILVALAFVLDYVANIYSGWFWPFGGSISISLVPLAIIAFRYGWVAGFLGGFTMGLLQLLTGAYIMHPIQVLFDYPLPYAVLGFAGFFASKVNAVEVGRRSLYIWLATGIGSIARLVCHIISGVVFFADYAPEGMNPVVYSVGYNTPFVLASYILSAIILVILYKRYANQLVRIPKEKVVTPSSETAASV
ncbi:energy-coupled thiamine transporter ThiT [Turicibacter sanguinis]|jgi:probable proton-coupled thiamine transporter yuaJ|uniref:energy-coupled thiamine transporter ThiT n=1 Tax=Turicibacter sanguinis TaxID=154288 RepID=UPI0006C5E84B|nr:energy-coupled thiamine transporter ThiT [Turicibacter sanguinis]MDB8436861.1 energy-coupled thiamine transporter ThiT [Turicibacter sanguinis]MDB8457991.1 energy-coupled thiamine transporter ThiT [Turicibacter sanguinis]MDB8543824.1 energy-coupled thiamine transporter ThiT [Turicibacter sanguinis]MDB8554560.1 energy-coupled thiamine transporter ThiT [Turicibacter sanguinis]MDB8557613.1 energy-coupled thiamine transporter ThiT [Turicibacter sanguinis]